MRQRSTTWKNLAADGEFSIETVAVINGTEYSTITAPIVNHGLLPSSELSVGNCISASLNFTVMTTDSIPKSAKVVIKSRLTDGSTYSEWLEFGTFWISHRDVDDDLITLECHDAMLMANQEYGGSEDAMNWPKPMSTVVNAIATRLGVSVDSRTIIKTGSDYVVAYPGDMTMLEVLGYIGACHGGNWIITHENKLRLVPVVAPPTSAQASSVVNVPVVIGELSTGQEYTVSRVTMAIDDETVYTAGDDSGFELKMDYNPYATQGIVNDLLNALGGIRYVPFNIESACYDPAAELGDQIIVGSVYSVLFNENRTYDLDFRADAEAPGGDELEDEYPYPSEVIRLQQSTVKLNRRINDAIQDYTSKIEQTQKSILLSVSQTYATKTSVVEAKNVTIVSDQLHYLATSAGSGVTKNTSGWSTGVQSVTATNKYLWTYHTYTYGDNHTSDTTPVITGVYGDQGQTGPAGGTGPQGPTGTSISEVVPLYYASSSSAAPSAPTSNVTRTSTDAGYWTRSLPAVSTSYPYLYTCDQVKYSNNTYAWTTVVKDNAICDLSTRMNSAELKITDSAIISTVTSTTAGQNAVNSLIEQQADSIRLQASTIAWDSEYSSMSADGVLRCQGANISGTLHTESGNGEWLDVEYGYIAGGESSETQDGRIIFGNYVEGTTGGIMLQSDCLYLDNGEVYVNNPDDGVLHRAYTGTIVIIAEHDGFTTETTLTFVNGLLI